jgi:hypothetical protein
MYERIDTFEQGSPLSADSRFHCFRLLLGNLLAATNAAELIPLTLRQGVLR